ncbi:MAG: hypothetical protein COU71_00365 [Parcubacteria group bacterium CG10_big_fil_rev_8_21_14_0_10_38_31]|nr:MAG: hypothetical protein COU71_00365 [Parcubacteria group bacterium CG10_big_fil_rev_8_21_14_0_10_38_31]
MNQDDRIKKYLKVTGIFAMLVLSYVALSFASSYSRAIDPTSLRSFSVSGEGKVVAIPDVAQFTFNVVTEGDVDVTKLQAENTVKTNKAINFIKENGVEDKDIRTLSYNIEPRYQYYNCGVRPLYTSETYPIQEPCPPSEIVGYTIRQTISVKVRDFSKTGDILSGIVENGANTVSSLNFTIDDQKGIEKEARDIAIKEAREKAREIAKTAKFRVGDIISINEGYSTPFVRYSLSETSMAGAKDASVPAPSIEPGSQEIIVNVTIQYEIR